MTDPQRPNPDALLAQVERATTSDDPPTGRLKVFFGAAPGVGKTYAMLEEARKAASEGTDVVIGYAEPHIRSETESLLLGLELLPYKMVEYRGAKLKEFDLAAALARRPKLLCVDELAHTNAPGMLHEKRWQDVMDLVDAGIDVYTTLNVQHLESVNDIIERITGVKVQETLPDAVLDQADEIELIDTTPEELTERLREGKVYRPDIAERAIRQFFNKGNLTALRELALRRTAERVDQQMQEQRQRGQVRRTWAASERLLVCVGPSPLSARLVRSTRRLATSLRAPWVAVTIETPGTLALPTAPRERINAHLRLAQQLGGEAVTLSGENVAEVLTGYARERNVTKIIIGKPELPRWRERLFGSLVDDVIRASGDIDVYVIRGEETAVAATRRGSKPGATDWAGYLAAVGMTTTATGIGWVMHRWLNLSDTNVLMVYLLGVLGVSWWFRRRASVLATVLAVVVFDFTFVPPFFSFAVTDRQYVITFGVMLMTGLLIGTLVHRTRQQAELFSKRQTLTQLLLDFSAELGKHESVMAIAQAATARIGATFGLPCAVLLRGQDGELQVVAEHGEQFAVDAKEGAVARWAADHDEPAGAGTATLPMASGVYLPLRGSADKVIGVMGLKPGLSNPVRETDDLRLLESLAMQAATGMERAELAADSREAWQRVEQENLRNTLLSAVSHDLRTPLAAITGAASALGEPSIAFTEGARRELAETIVAESRRMERVISNLLDITRFEAGGVSVTRQPVHMGELVMAVRHRLAGKLASRPFTVEVENDLGDVACDPVLIDQVVTHLIENAMDHTPAGSAIDVVIKGDMGGVAVVISDSGPGVPMGQERRVFEKFVRLGEARDRRGLGLGLAISKAIVEGHGGTIDVRNRDGGGASFRFALPAGELSRKSKGNS